MKGLFCVLVAFSLVALPGPTPAATVPAGWPPGIASSTGFARVGRGIAQEPGFPKDGSTIEKADYIFSRMDAVATTYNLKAGSGWPLDQAIIKLYRSLGDTFPSKSDPEFAESLKSGYGTGNCAEWSYAFDEILNAAGVQSTVVFGDNYRAPGHSETFWGTDTALYVTETDADGNISRRIYDVFQAALKSGTHQPTATTLKSWDDLPMTDADLTASERAAGRKSWLSIIGKKYVKLAKTEKLLDNSVSVALTVEVLDSETDKPLASAKVTLYKPGKFPGTAIASKSTGANGEAVFSQQAVGQAKVAGAARVGATLKGFTPTVQDVAAALLLQQGKRYVVYLKPTAATLAGTWTLSTGCSYAGGGTDPNKMHKLTGPLKIERASNGSYSGRFGEGAAMGGNVESASLAGEIATLNLHPTFYSEDPKPGGQDDFNNGHGWASRLQLHGKLSSDAHEITGTVTHNGPKPDCDFTMTRE